MIRRLLPFLLLLLLPHTALAANDARMQIEILADDEKGQTVEYLHGNIRKAADLALPQLWQRIVLQADQHKIPNNVKAVLFLQRATPVENGVSVTFNQRRVISFLKKNDIAHIPEQPNWILSVQLSNASGRSMPESAAMLQEYAAKTGSDWGYGLDGGSESLVLHWRWLDSRQITLSVRGTSKLGELAETRTVRSGDPFRQLKPWLSEIMLQARDAYASNAIPVEVAPTLTTGATKEASPQKTFLTLSIERQASLPEQVLFEEELRRDPRILDLSLKQVNPDGQQYRLQLRDADDQWLTHWFKRRGLTLSPTIEGWVAR
ncbi:hypothetical protein F3F96_04565 [Mariprofundus sp. NF]|uniref:hypothetical protein n=1 Tax=Mariprofundus sp. NF TaxID=2608716 RepID=UPI0015A44B4B|nr:hypothetical protein [Mariprofundus sp. NF]NWF38400.1 hypothetical protein [Mariprofundus sp. NF]